MFKVMEMKRMESEREVLEKSIDEFVERQSKEILDAIVTCFEEDPTKNDGRKIDIDKFSSFVFDYEKVMTILMNNKDFAENVIKAMDDRLVVLNEEFDYFKKIGYDEVIFRVSKHIENLKEFRKCIVDGGKKMENKMKTFDDLIEVVRDENRAGRIKSFKLETLPDNAQCSTIRFVKGDNKSERETRISRSEGYDYTNIINDILGVDKDEKKTYSDFVDVATDLYKRGLVGLVLDDTGISIDKSDIYHHFHKCEKQGSIFTHSSITHSHKGIDRIIDFEEAIEIAKTFEKEVIEITDLKSLQKVKEGADGVLANREKFSVVRDHTKYGGSDTLGISFETKDIVNLPLTVLMGATIKQERD